MTSSPHGASPWYVYEPQAEHESEADYDLLVQEPPPPAYEPQYPHHPVATPAAMDPAEAAPATAPVETSRSERDVGFADEPEAFESYDVGSAYAVSTGVTGRGIAVLSVIAGTACAGVDFALTGGLSYFFDLCFIVVCLVAAMSVRRRDLFTAGVLPPLAFAAVIGAVAILAPTTLADTGGVSRAFLTGLAAHAPGLVFGYAIALCAVSGRLVARRLA